MTQTENKTLELVMNNSNTCAAASDGEGDIHDRLRDGMKCGLRPILLGITRTMRTSNHVCIPRVEPGVSQMFFKS